MTLLHSSAPVCVCLCVGSCTCAWCECVSNGEVCPASPALVNIHYPHPLQQLSLPASPFAWELFQRVPGRKSTASQRSPSRRTQRTKGRVRSTFIPIYLCPPFLSVLLRRWLLLIIRLNAGQLAFFARPFGARFGRHA